MYAGRFAVLGRLSKVCSGKQTAIPFFLDNSLLECILVSFQPIPSCLAECGSTEPAPWSCVHPRSDSDARVVVGSRLSSRAWRRLRNLQPCPLSTGVTLLPWALPFFWSGRYIRK